MNAHNKKKLKAWLKNHPNKKLVRIWTIFLIAFAFYLIYRLGYVIGVFLANIGF